MTRTTAGKGGFVADLPEDYLPESGKAELSNAILTVLYNRFRLRKGTLIHLTITTPTFEVPDLL